VPPAPLEPPVPAVPLAAPEPVVPLEPVAPVVPPEPLEPVAPADPLEPVEPAVPLEPLELPLLVPAAVPGEVLALSPWLRPQAVKEASSRAPINKLRVRSMM
jgi:hypothetical protein